MLSILIVEDDPRSRASLELQLADAGYAATGVGSAEEALELLSSSPRPDAIILDVRLPGVSGVELARRLRDRGELPATVVVSGESSISDAVQALKFGVYDFIEKPVATARLLHSLQNALEHSALRREVTSLRLAEECPILGSSPSIAALLDRLRRAAPTEAGILVCGESGTGKELVADLIHRLSPRSAGPLVKVNCAALPAPLVEAELFGHRKGAFTDARTDRAGVFEQAHGGTLFLDEIGDMEYALQSRLLRVLEDGRVRRIGATDEREVDVRVVAATHQDLREAIRDGRFREDLFYRLSPLVLDVPPLRRRPGDVALLFRHYLDDSCRRNQLPNRRVEPEAIRRLEAHSWPGNVRELKNLCEQLVILGGESIRSADVDSALVETEAPPEHRDDPPRRTLREHRRDAERVYIERVLRHTRGNVSAAARILGVNRSHLHKKVEDLGIERED